MTDLEKELVEKIGAVAKAAVELAILRNNLSSEGEVDFDEETTAKIAEDAWNACQGIDTCAEEPNSELKALCSHTQALVAAAYAACAKTCLGNVLSEEQMNGEPNLHVGEMCLRLCHERDAAAIRKLTPADAARELERRELEGVRWIWEQDFADAYNGGYLTERGRELVLKRIASLSKPEVTIK